MKKLYLTLAATMLSFNANAFIVSPHVGLDYVSATPNGYGNIDSLNGGALSVGVKALGMVSVEGYYQKFFSTDAAHGSKTKPAAYGVDAVFDTLNLGVVELLTTVGYGKYSLDGGRLNSKMKGFEDKTYRAGFGAQFNPTSNIGIRAMYRYVFPEDKFFKKNVQELTVGVRYYFF
ncbi:MAG: porin family protein [Acetobacter sp.]|nr:porin family protein [Acetobacter sp.]